MFWQVALLTELSFAFVVSPPRRRGLIQAAPRFIDGPSDIVETEKVASFARNGFADGVATSVLYFSARDSNHGASMATFEAVAAATPDCEFLLAAVEKEQGAAAFSRVFEEGSPSMQGFDPVVEVLFRGERFVVGPGELASLLASLGFTPGKPSPSSPPSPVDDLWNLSGPSRRKNAKAPPAPRTRTTQRFFPSMNDAPPFFESIQKRQQQNREEEEKKRRQQEASRPLRQQQQQQPAVGSIRKALDKFGKDVEKSTSEFGKNLGQAADSASREAEKLGAKITGGETSRDKLDRLFQSDIDLSQLPPEERVVVSEKKKKKKVSRKNDDDDDWLDSIAYTPPE